MYVRLGTRTKDPSQISRRSSQRTGARTKRWILRLDATFETFSDVAIRHFETKADGSALQAALHDWTGQRTVPNVFIGGKHVGGCDDTVRLHQEGKLVPMLTEAGAITSAL